MNDTLNKTMVPGTQRTEELLAAAEPLLAVRVDTPPPEPSLAEPPAPTASAEGDKPQPPENTQSAAGGLQVTVISTDEAASIPRAAWKSLAAHEPAAPLLVQAADLANPPPLEGMSHLLDRWELSVVGFCFSPSGTQVALIEKDRPEWQRGKYNGPGGRVHDGEGIPAAMSREFGEETGVYISADRWQHIRTEEFLPAGEAVPARSVCYFATYATMVEWDAIHTAEREKVVKLPYPVPAVETANLIPNLQYMIPMAHVLYERPADELPLP